jgi:hypothetical protein
MVVREVGFNPFRAFWGMRAVGKACKVRGLVPRKEHPCQAGSAEPCLCLGATAVCGQFCPAPAGRCGQVWAVPATAVDTHVSCSGPGHWAGRSVGEGRPGALRSAHAVRGAVYGYVYFFPDAASAAPSMRTAIAGPDAPGAQWLGEAMREHRITSM